MAGPTGHLPACQGKSRLEDGTYHAKGAFTLVREATEKADIVYK